MERGATGQILQSCNDAAHAWGHDVDDDSSSTHRFRGIRAASPNRLLGTGQPELAQSTARAALEMRPILITGGHSIRVSACSPAHDLISRGLLRPGDYSRPPQCLYRDEIIDNRWEENTRAVVHVVLSKASAAAIKPSHWCGARDPRAGLVSRDTVE